MEANWVIEVTRRCKLKCAHCLRGARQNIDMEPYFFRNIIDKFEINNLTITGGEPLLNIPILNEIICSNIDMLYIATSGFVDDIETVFDKLYQIKTKKYMEMYIDISSDKYHKKTPYEFVDMLEMYGFEAGKKDNMKYNEALGIGRAYDNQVGFKDAEEYLSLPDDDTSTIMINIFGDVYPGCDYSYKAQKRFKNKLCLGNVNTHSVEQIEENYLKLIGNSNKKLLYNEKEFQLIENC